MKDLVAYMENRSINNIRKASIFLVSGIFAIIAFFNTAMIEQSKLLEVPLNELKGIMAWIDSYTIHLLRSGLILLVGMFPLYEVSNQIYILICPTKELKPKWFDVLTTISFLIGSIYLFILFVSYIWNF